MEQKRPRSREKNVTGQGLGVNKRGSGLGTGPVGKGTAGSFSSSSSKAPKRAIGGGSLGIIVILVIFFLTRGSGGGVSSLGQAQGAPEGLGTSQTQTNVTAQSSGGSEVDSTVAQGAREKRTNILGSGNDVATIMVYMCGTDLESKSGMATADLNEMLGATISDKINLIVYTGGCKQWKNNMISSQVNQIYLVKDGKLVCLEDNMGSKAMTNPATLTEFINYCTKNYPANRNDLIFWDHGGGSLSGYGYDEKNASSGSMTLAGINTALANAGTYFDFIGFDACLMATLENGLMLEPYADYMIASEETEPGVGWYYTNWLTAFSKNTSLPTIQIGKNIVDDFVDVCNQKCYGQKTTLSVVDLCELKATVPDKLTDFAKTTNELIKNEQYKLVSDARGSSREFAQSSKIDQIDFVNFCNNLNTEESKALADAMLSAVKYNRTATCITQANGLSVYFPYKKAGNVRNAVSTYQAIGMDNEYSKCIQEFAGLEASGQISAGGSSSPMPSLLGSLLGGSASGGSSDMISSMIGGLLSGSTSGSAFGLDSSVVDLLSGRALSTEETAEYISNNYFNPEALVFTKGDDDKYRIKLSEDQWDLVTQIELNVFVDDGEGYIDLGLDNTYDFDDEGNLIADYDNTWIAINNQPVAYYLLDVVEDGDDYVISGVVPCMLNGERAELILNFDQDNPNGYIAGAKYVYTDGQTDTTAKNLTEVGSGDQVDFICDYYSYDGEYQDSYYLGETMTLTDDNVISNVELSDKPARVTYKFTDIYQASYWTPVLP